MKTRWVAMDPASFVGRTVGDGQCVEFVRKATPGLPETARWQRGPKVVGTPLEPGTIIATFTGGRYTSATDGSSHAAVYMDTLNEGIVVFDQWVTHPVASRIIAFKYGAGLACDDGMAFYCVETEHGR
jgi:hypothetical protein